MANIDLTLRMELFRARSALSLPHADSLIHDVASSCLDVRVDNATCGVVEHQDYLIFCHVDGVALVAIFRESDVEFLAFAADESLIHEAEHLAMVDVTEFLQIARSRFQLPDVGLVLPMSEALPWMEQHRRIATHGDTTHVA